MVNVNVTDTLIKAGLLNEVQIQVALHDQMLNPNMRLSEILSLRGWIAEETVDFFELLWDMRVKQGDRRRLGEYLVEARLLTAAQVEDVVTEQKVSNLRFGEVAVLKGYLKQETVRFFIKYLFPQNIKVKEVSPFSRTTQTQAHQRTLNSESTVQQTEESVAATKRQHQQRKPQRPKPFPPQAPAKKSAQRNMLNRLKEQVQHKLSEVHAPHRRERNHSGTSPSTSSRSTPPRNSRSVADHAFSTSYDLSSGDDEDLGLDEF